MIDPRWIIFTAPSRKPLSCILALPGRAQHGLEVARCWLGVDLNDTMIVAITPQERQWYPMPIGPDNQDEAVAGLETARQVIEDVIDRIESEYNIPSNRIALTGFSAGGVMSVYTGMHSERELAGIACHAGAILDPDSTPICKFPQMPIVLAHAEDDEVFSWEERYQPMLTALESSNYNVFSCESTFGGHNIDYEDIQYSALVLSERFGYSNEWYKKHKEEWFPEETNPSS